MPQSQSFFDIMLHFCAFADIQQHVNQNTRVNPCKNPGPSRDFTRPGKYNIVSFCISLYPRRIPCIRGISCIRGKFLVFEEYPCIRGHFFVFGEIPCIRGFSLYSRIFLVFEEVPCIRGKFLVFEGILCVLDMLVKGVFSACCFGHGFIVMSKMTSACG
jgi:hypothetical protein